MSDLGLKNDIFYTPKLHTKSYKFCQKSTYKLCQYKLIHGAAELASKNPN
jgi:hypothetical protein